MTRLRLLIPLLLSLALAAAAQDEAADGCGAAALTRQQETLAAYLTLDFAKDGEMALANLFRLGALYRSMALGCGYQPNPGGKSM